MPKGGQSRLGRGTKHRLAMLKNMVTSLIWHERIKTTVPRAKSLRIVADKMVTHGKKGTLHSRRTAEKMIQDRGALKKLFDVLGPRYAERAGGYTRVLKLGQPRMGDKADMAVIEFVDRRGELRQARPVSQGLRDLLPPPAPGSGDESESQSAEIKL